MPALADGRSYRYSIKEAYVDKVVSDSAGSTSGPTYTGFPRKIDLVQKLTIKNQDKIDKLNGDDSVGGIEQSLEEAQVSLEFGKRNHAAMSMLSGAAHWQQPGESHYAITENAIAPDVKIIARTTKIGKNGADVWVIVYKAKFGGDGVDLTGKAFGQNQLTGSAGLTDSTVKVIRDGATVQERIIWEEIEHAVAVALVAAPADSDAPVLSSSVPADAASSVSKTANCTVTLDHSLDPATVNEYTCFIKRGSTLLTDVVVTLDDDTITFAHGAFTGAAAHTIYITTTVMGTNGVNVATQIEVDFTTAA